MLFLTGWHLWLINYRSAQKHRIFNLSSFTENIYLLQSLLIKSWSLTFSQFLWITFYRKYFAFLVLLPCIFLKENWIILQKTVIIVSYNCISIIAFLADPIKIMIVKILKSTLYKLSLRPGDLELGMLFQIRNTILKISNRCI
jgi:hypothetical protein